MYHIKEKENKFVSAAIAAMVKYMEEVVKHHWPEHLQSWPALKTYDAKGYITDQFIILCIKNKLQGWPSLGLCLDDIDFSDMPSFQLTPQSSKDICTYLSRKFNLEKSDFGVVMPLKIKDGWPADFNSLPEAVNQHIAYQILIFAEEYYKTIPERKIVNHVVTTGNNNKVLVNSTDNSVNINGIDIPTVFQDMKDVLFNIESEKDRESIANAIQGMESSFKKEDFIEKYNNFMNVAAAHLTVFLPMIPALSGLLHL